MTIKFGLDIDGCLFDFMKSFSEYLKIEHNIIFDTKKVRKFKIGIDGIPYDKTAEYINYVLKNWKSYTFPYVKESIKELYKMGFEFIIITARKEELFEKTNKDLKELIFNDIPYELIFERYKHKIVRDLQIKYFYEDRFRNVNKIGKYLDYIFCPIRAHNSGREFKVNNMIRINDMREIVNFFKDKNIRKGE